MKLEKIEKTEWWAFLTDKEKAQLRKLDKRIPHDRIAQFDETAKVLRNRAYVRQFREKNEPAT